MKIKWTCIHFSRLYRDSIKDDKLKVIRIKEKINQNIYLVTKKRPVQFEIVSLFKNYINEYNKRDL